MLPRKTLCSWLCPLWGPSAKLSSAWLPPLPRWLPGLYWLPHQRHPALRFLTASA